MERCQEVATTFVFNYCCVVFKESESHFIHKICGKHVIATASTASSHQCALQPADLALTPYKHKAALLS